MSFGPRSSGVLLHLTSIGGSFGCGDLGDSARKFVDFLAASGQRWWQLLPVQPVGPGESPYMPPSAFAGHRLLIAPDELVAQGWLTPGEADGHRAPVNAAADFHHARTSRNALLTRAFDRFDADSGARAALAAYSERERDWLADHALFQALRARYSGKLWMNWPPTLARHEPAALVRARRKYEREVRFQEFLQFAFQTQWDALRQYASERGIAFIGDVPHLVDGGGSDVWAHRELFQLEPGGHPRRVSGTRPDVFQPEGQRWGHPLYNWDAHRSEGFAWWRARSARTLALHDTLRLDHFPGFVRTWSLPGTDASDPEGRFEDGPGAELFEAMRDVAPSHILVAEDLGDVDETVEDLRDQLQIRGMTLLCHELRQLGDSNSDEPPFNGIREESVVYTSNHDTDTAQGEFDALEPEVQSRVREALGMDPDSSVADALIQRALDAPADTAILAAQDLLGLGSPARMNRPGTATDNWGWRAPEGAFDESLAESLRSRCVAAGRVG